MNEFLNDTLVMPGGPLKSLGVETKGGKTYGKIGGYLVVHGDAAQTDLAGDWFTKNTYLGPQNGDSSEALFHHTLPIKGFEAKRDHRFAPWKTKRDNYGLFAETVMDLSDDYDRAVFGTVMAGKMGLSSGSAPHLVRREGDTFEKPVECGEIKMWSIVEGSITPSPCEPRARVAATKATYLKALVETVDGVFDVPDAVAEEIDRLRYRASESETQADVAKEQVFALGEKAALQRRLISLQISSMSLMNAI